MSEPAGAKVHGSAVRIGQHGVLIRGASGAGKSRLAFDLILAGRAGQIPPTVLIGDDRVWLQPRQHQLMARPVRELAGLIEIRGLGIRRCDFVAEAAISLLVDLSAPDAARLPSEEALTANLFGAAIPRIPVAPGFSGLSLVIAALTTTEAVVSTHTTGDCLKGIGNHINHTIVS
jgi:serine kinase of HPr protein (carbohydrate metabolism regulator)